MALFRPVGEPLYLTPYINSGDIATGRQRAQITDPLLGYDQGVGQPDGFSGFITVNEDEEKDSNM